MVQKKKLCENAGGPSEQASSLGGKDDQNDGKLLCNNGTVTG